MIKSISRFAHYVIMGDFNLPHICWETYTLKSGNTGAEQLFLEMLMESKMVQHVMEPTRRQPNQKANCLDLVFSDGANQIGDVKIDEPLGASDHCTLTALLHHHQMSRSKDRLLPNVWKADFNAMLQEAKETVWFSTNAIDVNELWVDFHESLVLLERRHIPMKKGANAHRAPRG
jgi:hypothetical protein